MMELEFQPEHPYFNRREIHSLLEKRLKAFAEGYRQNIAFLGREFLGKSLLLRKLVAEQTDGKILPVYVGLAREPFEYFAQRFMAALLYGFLKAKGKLISSDFSELINRSRRYVPRTLKQMRLIKRLLIRGRLKESYGLLVTLPRILSEESGLKMLLVLDEFDRLNDYNLQDPFKELGTELMLQKDTFFIISSSREDEARAILKGKLSLLFGNFETVEIKPLAFAEAREFIQLFLKGLAIKESLVKFLTQLTDGHPYYFHRILERLRNLALLKTQQTVTEEIFIQGLTAELYSEHGFLYQYFSNKIENLQQGKMASLYLTALLGIALGKRRVRELSRYLERPQSDTQKILGRLLDGGILVRSGSFHTLNDPLFIFWLKHVFEAEKRDLGMRSPAAREKFKTDLNRAFEEFAAEDKKELSKRVEELLRQFTHEDTIELAGKRLRCQDFDEVTSRPSPSGRLTSLLATSSQTRWMCQIAQKPVSEEEVGEFLEVMDRYKKPIKNRILVALSGIGLNAKLLAQESRIHIWDLKNLNFLLSLFGKNKIILNG